MGGAPGAVFEQTGLPQLPVQHVTLVYGWNWIGHAPLHIYPLTEIASVDGSPQFSADDQVKARAGSNLKYSTFTGQIWSSSRLASVTSSRWRRRLPSATETCAGRPTSPASHLRHHYTITQRAAVVGPRRRTLLDDALAHT